MINYLRIISSMCTECGQMTKIYYQKSSLVKDKEWWDTFLDKDEVLCSLCIEKRKGFVDLAESKMR